MEDSRFHREVHCFSLEHMIVHRKSKGKFPMGLVLFENC
jgi:hypothetical protein